MEKEASETVMFSSDTNTDSDCYNNNITINNNSNNKIRDEKVAAMTRRRELEDCEADFTNSATSWSMTAAAATNTNNKNNNISRNNKVEVYDDDDDDDDCGGDVSEDCRSAPPTASPTDSCSSLLLLPPPPTDAAAAAAATAVSLPHLTLTPSTTNSNSSRFGSAAAPQFLTSAKLSEREAINMSTSRDGQCWTQLSPSTVYTFIYWSPLNKSYTNKEPLLLPPSPSSNSSSSSSSISLPSTFSSSTTASSSSSPSVTTSVTPSELSPLPPPPPPPPLPSSSSVSSSPLPPPPVVEAMVSPTGTAPSDLPKSPSFPVANTTVPRIQCSKPTPMLTLNRLSNTTASSFNYHGSGFGSWTKYLFFMLLVVVQLLSQPVDSAQPRTQRSAGTNIQKKGMKYLMEFGYVNGPSLEMENLMSEEAQVKAIRRFQAFANLPLTGRLDHRTIEWMEKPRCGNKDTLPEDTWGNERKKRYVISGSQWEKTNLTFRFLNYSPDVKFTKIRTVIYEAFRVWSQVTHLTFTEIMFGSAKKDADIRIMFAQKFHHDGYPFDGPGNILAHAFFPGENKGGDAHFDDDENWTVDSDEGVNLFMVAAHEFGHALGLSHSKTPGSLMYPWYAGKQSKYYTLPKDDVEGIQKLYGVKNSNNTPVIVLVPNHEGSKEDKDEKKEEEEDENKDEGFVDNCTHKFDAITRIRGDVYIFKGKYFWRWESGGMKDSSPILITQFWYNYPEDSVDAVFERKKGSKIMFFKGNKYWLYDANHMEKAWPIEGRPLTELGLPADLKKIDAAFTWSYNKRTYLVSDDMYWKFDENENYVVYDYPRDMKIWQGVPTPLDAAFQFNDGKTYFIKGKHYWEFLDSQMRVKTKLPTGNISERWMQCKTPPKNIGLPKSSHGVPTPSKGFSALSLMALPNLVLLSLLTSYL